MSERNGPGIDVVGLGETMVQLVPDGAPGFTGTDRAMLHQAGAESNVVIGLSRLGARTAWVSRLGDDAFGARIRDALAAEGVDCGAVAVDAAAQTGLFVKEVRGDTRKVHYYRKDSAASRMTRADVERALALEPRVLLSSGVTAALSGSCEAALRFAVEAAPASGSVFAFDVNYRPVLWPTVAEASAVLCDIAEGSDLVFIGLDEAEALWGCETPDEVRRTLSTPETLVVKDGPRAATVYAGGHREEVPALPVEVVDAVGAGDAFAAGFLFGTLRGWGSVDSVKAGHRLAAAALVSTTDQGEAMSAAELEHRIRDPRTWGPTPESRGAHHDER